MNRRTLVLAAGMLMLAAPSARADTVITDFLDRIGGCHKPMSESFSYEISPYTAKPYGKALGEWTDEDVANFRAYFIACQTHRPDWSSMGDYNRNDAIRVIDTAMAELRDNVERARATVGKQRADAAYESEKRRREDEQRQAEAVAAEQRAAADQAAQAERAGRNEAAKNKVMSFLQELIAFTQNELGSLPPDQKLARLDGYLAQMQALKGEVGDAPAAKPLLAVLEQTRGLRDQIMAERARQAAAPRPAPIAGDGANSEAGPFTDYEWLGQQGIMAMKNPLQRESFRASLARGIDFNVGVSAIEPEPRGWLVQLSGRLGVPGKPGQGFFCRVAASDPASIAVLRTVTPPYGIIHAAAPGVDQFIFESNPLHMRIVFRDCRVTPLDNGSRRSGGGATHGTTALGSGALGDAAGTGPVAPSPLNLRCQTNPPRREHERVMAHRLRQVWAIPEALRNDPTLLLTFAVTLNFDAELTGPVELKRSQSQRATPEQLRAAAEAGREAILASAPFPELGQFAGGTMQIDMTPCD